MSDPGEVLDAILEAARARSAAPATTPPSRTAAPLALSVDRFPVPDETPRAWDGVDPALRECLRELVRGKLDWPLYLTGGPGRGKSAAVLLLADHCRGAVYFRFSRFLKAMDWARSEQGYSLPLWSTVNRGRREEHELRRHPHSETQLWNRLCAAPLVVLDDVATRGGYTEPQYDLFADLLEARKARPLIVVSNLPLGELARVFDDRVASRLAAGTLFTLAGPDRRLDGKTAPVAPPRRGGGPEAPAG